MFIHPKIAATEPVKSPIENVLTPLYSDLGKTRDEAPAPHRRAPASPQALGQWQAAMRAANRSTRDALVQAITDQVMAALNGSAR